MSTIPSVLTVGHFQLQVSSRFEDNFRVFKDSLRRATEARLDIATFPECFLTGYFGTEKQSRKSAFAVSSAKMRKVLAATRSFKGVVVVGFNEDRKGDLYNTALVARRGKRMGLYSKCMAYMPFHHRGREFPIFEHKGWKFGVLICADGGYIEPARILTLKGAQLIVAPHYNYIANDHVLLHYQSAKADHISRARENNIWFLRANNVSAGNDPKFNYSGIAYGDSYMINPQGEIMAQSALQKEDLVVARLDPKLFPTTWRRNLVGFVELGDIWLKELAGVQLTKVEAQSVRHGKVKRLKK